MHETLREPKMKNAKRIALVGIEGFSQHHLGQIKRLESEGEVKLCAMAIRAASVESQPAIMERLNAERVKVYPAYEAMLVGERGLTDIVVIPTGIGDHCEMTVAALEAGYHVICEKPAAATLEECMQMKQAQERSGRVLGICFQHIYSPTIQRMKSIALSGELGALKSAKSYVLWQRADAYYGHTWRGRLALEGKTVNDCPAMNATAHFLNNMLYMAGKSLHEAAEPVAIYGENYRVKNIESCDTQFLRAVTETGVELMFITTHATDVRVDPRAEYHFEKGKITWGAIGGAVVHRKIDGRYVETERFHDNGAELFKLLYRGIFAAIENETEPVAALGNSYQHVKCIEKSFESGPIIDVPREYLGSTDVIEDDDCLKAGDTNWYIKGIKPLMERMYAEGMSFYEIGCPWAVQSKVVSVDEQKPDCFVAPGHRRALVQ